MPSLLQLIGFVILSVSEGSLWPPIICASSVGIAALKIGLFNHLLG